MQPRKPNGLEDARADEPEETKHITKKALHTRLNNEFYIPDHTTRGVNRAYLVGVFLGAKWRVPLLEWKRFDAELTPAQKTKAPILCGSNAAAKINRFLEETNRPTLGFSPGLFPDEKWFINVARYIDKANVTGLFLHSLPNSPAPVCITSRMMSAKKNAEEYLLGQRNLLDRPNIYSQIKDVWEGQKKLVSKRMELQALVEHGRELEERIRDEEDKLNAKVLQASMTIFAYGNNIEHADQIFHEENGGIHRNQVNQITEM